MRPLPLFALLLSCGAFGCRVPEAGLHVVVEGALTPGVDFDRLSLVASSDGKPLLAEVVEGEELTLPFTFNVLSGPATPPGTRVSLLASAEREGEVVSAIRGEAELQSGTGSTLVLTLPDLVPTSPDGGAPPELCDDGFDDDGDGLADCADPDCASKACADDGLVCSAGACGCGEDGRVGTWRQPLPGLADRTAVRLLMLERGARAGWWVLAGGEEDGSASPKLELFRPGQNLLEPLSPSPARGAVALVELSDGSVVLIGGEDASGAALSTVSRLSFDGGTPKLDAVTLSAPLPLNDAHAFRVGGGDAVYVTGGDLGARLVRLGFDAAFTEATWEELPPLSASRETSAALGDGRRVLASGPDATTQVDLVTSDGALHSGPPLPVPVAKAALAQTAGGRVLVVEGGGAQSSRAFLLEVVGEAVSVRETGGVPAALEAPKAVPLERGWVYVQDAGSRTAWWYDPASGAFVAAAEPVPSSAPAWSDEALGTSGRAVYRIAGGEAQVLERRCPQG